MLPSKQRSITQDGLQKQPESVNHQETVLTKATTQLTSSAPKEERNPNTRAKRDSIMANSLFGPEETDRGEEKERGKGQNVGTVSSPGREKKSQEAAGAQDGEDKEAAREEKEVAAAAEGQEAPVKDEDGGASPVVEKKPEKPDSNPPTTYHLIPRRSLKIETPRYKVQALADDFVKEFLAKPTTPSTPILTKGPEPENQLKCAAYSTQQGKSSAKVTKMNQDNFFCFERVLLSDH